MSGSNTHLVSSRHASGRSNANSYPKSTTDTPVVRRRHAHDGIEKSQNARRQSAHAMHQ